MTMIMENAPDCPHVERLDAIGCAECELYRCPTCNKIRPWSNGGSETLDCDECWSEKEKGKPRPPVLHKKEEKRWKKNKKERRETKERIERKRKR